MVVNFLPLEIFSSSKTLLVDTVDEAKDSEGLSHWPLLLNTESYGARQTTRGGGGGDT